MPVDQWSGVYYEITERQDVEWPEGFPGYDADRFEYVERPTLREDREEGLSNFALEILVPEQLAGKDREDLIRGRISILEDLLRVDPKVVSFASRRRDA
jgi:hypothetical protein